jgi:hypothetical protein
MVAYANAAASTPMTQVAAGVSGIPTAPAVNVTVPNTTVVSVLGIYDTYYSTTPTQGTTRIYQSSGGNYVNLLIADQTVAAAGKSSVVSGTTCTTCAATWWSGASFQLLPSGASAPAYVNSAYYGGVAASATVTVPTGISAGQYMVTCTVTELFSTTLSPPAGFTDLIPTPATGKGPLKCYGKTVGPEPASYTCTLNQTGAVVAAIIVYSGTSGHVTTAASNLFYTPSSTFTPSSVGQAICIADFFGSTMLYNGQSCGQIAAYVNPNVAALNFQTLSSLTNNNFAIGTDDSYAFLSAFNSTQCQTLGCTILTGPKKYGLTISLVFPNNVPLRLQGVNPSAQQTGNTIFTGNIGLNNGSVLDFMTTNLTTAGIGALGSILQSNVLSNSTISNLGLWGGTGVGSDGGRSRRNRCAFLAGPPR